ncbi:hypothetical protein [Labrys neptuniae]
MTMTQCAPIGQAYLRNDSEDRVEPHPPRRLWWWRREPGELSDAMLRDIGIVDGYEAADHAEPAASASDLIDRYR